MRIANLPRLAGVSKESVAMALGFLQRHGYAVVEPAPHGDRGKTIKLTVEGRRARAEYRRVIRSIDASWRTRFGDAVVARLQAALEPLIEGVQTPAALLAGLEPYPDGWRASLPPITCLPYYPMVLHRGGFPDGS